LGAWAGIDWAKDEHAVLVAGEHGEPLAERVFAHDEEGIAALCELLVGLAVERVTVERPDGLLVERLLAAGLCVFALHPNQVKAARPRFRSQGNSDRFDAFVLCELARADAHRFRPLAPDSDTTKAIRAATRTREDLVATRVALANPLGERFWPGAAAIFAEVDSQIALASLERYPSPRDARGLGERRLERFLHGHPGRRSAAELLERLHRAPEGPAGQLEAEALRGVVLALVATLRPLIGRICELEREIAHAVDAHPDGQVFLSLSRDPKSVVTAATLLAEMGDSRLRCPSAEALAADGGMSAVAVESGKRKHAARWACDKRLRAALATLANTSRHHNPWAADLYAGARARGHDHQRAIRNVGRAWSRVLWRMWHDRQPYDPSRHSRSKVDTGRLTGPAGEL
jgi:transposase